MLKNFFICILTLCVIVGCKHESKKTPIENEPKSTQTDAKNLLEKKLTTALSLSSNGINRLISSDQALIPYINKGYLHRKPDFQVDYNDYRFPIKKFYFRGHQIRLVDEEYMVKFIGCCVSEGLALTMDKKGEDLSKFAKENGCSIKNMNEVYLPDEVQQKLPKTDLITLSCKENDINS